MTRLGPASLFREIQRMSSVQYLRALTSMSGKLARHSMTFLGISLWMLKGLAIYRRYRKLTMASPFVFARNLALCSVGAPTTGCIVECGVWRGGMSAGIADMLPSRQHVLFDSFEGMPPATEADGDCAVAWQNDTTAIGYHDNCRAERGYAEGAMAMSAAKNYRLVQGWFSDTMADFVPPEPIAVLRLDADWYDSTMQCLEALYPKVMQRGLIIIDDYYAWDGCSRAVHDYLSRTQSLDKIEAWGSIAFIVKRNARSGD